jgi:hypothetical protein
MDCKTTFRVILLLALFAVSAAQAADNVLDTTKIDAVKSIVEGSDPASNILYLLVALNIMILVIYAMYGYFTQNDKELMNAKNEFGQLLVSMVIIMLTYALFITVNQLFLGQFQSVAGGTSVTSITAYNSKAFDAFRLDAENTMSAAYGTIVEDRADAAVTTTLPTLYTTTPAVVACGILSSGYIALAVFGPGAFLDSLIQCAFSFQTINMRQEAYKGVFADVLEMEVSSLMAPLFNLMVFMVLLGKFFIDRSLVYIFFGGIILRMSPWTRKAGDLLILVSLVAYIIYPFLYAVFLASAQSVKIDDICIGLGDDADLQPFGDCNGMTGIMKLGKYAVLSSFVASVILGLSLSILNNFRKVFEMVE